MNRNKKLVALICAMAMIFSMFAGLTVVNAEDATRGFAFENVVVSNEGKTITLDIVYKGYDLGLADFEIHADVPSAVTDIKTAANFVGATDNYANGVYDLTYAGVSNATAAKNVVATLTMTLASPLAKDDVMKLKGTTSASMMNADETDYTYTDKVADGNMVASTVTLPKYVDPNATEAPKPITTRPPKATAEPVATEDPNATTAPILKPDVTVTRGFDFKNVKVNGSTVTMDIVYVGYDLGLADFEIHADVPSAVTDIKTAANFVGATDNYANGVYDLTYAGVSNATAANNVVATLTMTLSSDATEAFQIELKDTTAASMMNADETDYTYTDKVADGNMQKAIVTIPVGGDVVVATPTPEPKSKTYTAPEIAKNADFTAPETNDGEVSNYRIAVTVTKGGQDVPYGAGGFVAKLGDKELTSVEYNNLLGGYIDEIKALGYNTVKDAFNALSFKVYADGANVAVQVLRADKDEDGNDIELVVGAGNQAVSFGPAPVLKPTLNVKAKVASKETTNPTSVSLVPGQLVTLTASSVDVDSPSYTFEITSGSGVITEDSVSTDTARYLAEKVGTAAVKVTCGTLTKTITINVTETEQGGNTVVVGGGDKGSVNGSIAHGSVITNGAGTEKIAFTDLDTVTWAQDAILALVAKGVINGRSNTIFDPNGTVTRAEFAKMVVLGFDLAGGTPGNFTDVNPNAWYATVVATAYHNNVISGYDDGTFRPNNQITRQEMAAMISRAIAASKKTLPAITSAIAFDDAWQIGNWAADAVTSLTQGGVITGMTDTTFAPLENATRAQAAVIINRAITNAK